MTEQEMNEKTLEELFDDGVDMTPFIEEGSGYFPHFEEPPRRVNFNFPAWMVDVLDAEAARLGISRQALVLVWLGDRIRQEGLPDNRPAS